MKKLALAVFALSTVSSFATTIITTNNRGPVATQEVLNSAGELVSGFGGFGLIDETGIDGVNTTFDSLSFVQFGAGGGLVTTATTGQFSFQETINIDTTGSEFDGSNIYLVVGFGGTSLETSTDLFVYKFDQTFVEQATPITNTLSSSPGEILLGSQGSGTYLASQITAIPEPSAALLGAFGLLGLLRRRRA